MTTKPQQPLPQLVGCDFSSSPHKRKPVVMAWGELRGPRVVLNHLELVPSLDLWSQTLQRPQAWVGGFDLPFGLPRALVEALHWPTEWHACIAHYTSLSREIIRAQFAAFCNARPVGHKFAHRATDLPAGSSPSMKWVNPPVAFMLHAGLPRLLQAGLHLPGLHDGDASRVALEAYPGLLARECIGRRSYKSDSKAQQTAERLIARKDIITRLENAQTQLGLQLKLSHSQREALVQDGSGDSLDAVLCMMQAGWALHAHLAGHACYGLPPFDPLEGWIVTA